MSKTAINPTREQNYPEWYQEVVKASELAENSPVRGSMIIRPWGWALWENIQSVLDGKFKATGHTNVYFPLLIPLSYFEKEAEHVEGFAKECAVVTHHRLEPGKEKGTLVPAGQLEEPYVIRPTSETIFGEYYSRHIQSYRDLPMKLNQWANVMRWEMRTRMFLRTTEFLWQEGHTVHATAEEAQQETRQMLDVYEEFVQNYLAMPVIKGGKTIGERFPGADSTYTIEAMMQDRKALQAGTSHFLGQNFAKASEIKFQDKDGNEQYAWTTSWGVSTRMVGGLIMTHSDDNGLVLPPKIAPLHIVILPIYRKDDERDDVLQYCNDLANQCRSLHYHHQQLMVEVDDRDMRGGEKTWYHIKKGVPIRLEIGPRDIANGQVFMGRRNLDPKDKKSLTKEEFIHSACDLLDDIQNDLFNRALQHQKDNTKEFDNFDDFKKFFTPKNENKPEIHGGFALCYAVDEEHIEEILKPLKVTARCIPLEQDDETGKCIFTGKETNRKIVFAKAY